MMNARSLGRFFVVSITSLLLLTNAGCLFGGKSKVKQEGNYVAQNTLSQIQTGKTTEAWVRAVIGEPTEKVSAGPDHAIWKYAYTETKDSSGYVFLIFSAADQKVNRNTVFIEFEKGIVTKTWRG